ncbi:CHAT domain-containing protein [Flammula alnicola]|nr:CHAT domain-containing protein [Flammula alnicola]
MNRAISITEVAIAYTPENDVNFPFLLSNLGDSFSTRFEHAGDLADIESAISSQQRAVQLTPEGHADLPSRLNNLGNSFSIRFERTGDLADIESAISGQQRAVQLTPEGYADLPSRLSNLGNSFSIRFERTGDLADIESAISSQQRAVQLTPEGHAYLPFRCNNLGNSFLTRFKCTGDLADIESAISSQQRAIQLTPEGRANLPNQLSNLGTSFSIRFKHTGDLADIESAISSQQRAVQLAPERHAELPFWLNNLGVSFKTRFKHTGDLADIESAILSQQRAVQLTPEEHVYLPPLLNNLGSFFETRFEHTKNPEDISHVISMYRLSAMQILGHPSRRLTAARKWAMLSRQFDQSASLNAFRVAIGLLSQVAGLEQTIHKRHMNLIDISDLTTSAAAAAFSNGEIGTALAWLEQGRCLVWTQINQLRTPADNLHVHDSSLADDFLNVAKALEASGSREEQSSPFSVENITQMIALQDESHTHVQLAKKWNELLSKIRCIPGFHDFLQPPETSNLLERLKCLALDGPVIIFNIHEERCDALALISGADTPLHIPLESFSHKQAVQLHDHFGKYLNNHHVRMREVDRSMKLWLPETGNVIYEVLRDLWLHVAKPILDALGYSHPSINRSRIWWCPTGPLTFLPIHAAGIYSKDKISSGPCVSDFVISSYTPSVSALLDKIKEAPTKDETSSSLLLISQPNTPGQSRIPATRQETHAIQDMMTVKGIKSLLLEDGAATAIRVKEEMTSHSWVHFACHAIQDAHEPLKSGVRLHDGRLELLEMMRQRIQNADHAFLSACQTSTGDEKLSDEAVHLAAGMLAAGYRGVVATMWSIKDQYGPEVAREFYTQILENTSGEVGKSSLMAMALLVHLIIVYRRFERGLGIRRLPS